MQKGGNSQMGNWLGNNFCMKRIHQHNIGRDGCETQS